MYFLPECKKKSEKKKEEEKKVKIKVFFFDNDGEKWPAKAELEIHLANCSLKIWSSDKCTQRVEAAKLCKSTCQHAHEEAPAKRF